MPFDAHHHHGDDRCRPAINRLEKAGAEDAVIDDISTDSDADLIAAVNFAAPVAGAQRIEMIGMFVFQQRLGFTVTALLLEIRLDGVAAIMPDLCCR